VGRKGHEGREGAGTIGLAGPAVGIEKKRRWATKDFGPNE
jgi:hypothetical protein